MKNLIYILFLFAIVLSSCKKSDARKAIVTLNFQTTADGNNYTFADSYENGDGTLIRLELLQFYLSDIRFIDKKGKEVLAEEIALLKTDLSGHASVEIKIPAGDYSALKFGIGVPNELNEKDPSSFTEEEHPLSSSQNTYWGMNGMYRFVMVDGRYDEDADGISDGTFSYHTGYAVSLREFELTRSFSFDKKVNYSQNFNIDVQRLFNVDGSRMDVINESNWHGNYDDIEVSIRFSDNFLHALTEQ